MNTVFVFGFKLAELLGQNDSVGLGVLSLAIKDAGKHPAQMGYQDYKEVFQHYLGARLSRMGVSDTDRVIEWLMRHLNENQSLFVMAAR